MLLGEDGGSNVQIIKAIKWWKTLLINFIRKKFMFYYTMTKIPLKWLFLNECFTFIFISTLLKSYSDFWYKLRHQCCEKIHLTCTNAENNYYFPFKKSHNPYGKGNLKEAISLSQITLFGCGQVFLGRKPSWGSD